MDANTAIAETQVAAKVEAGLLPADLPTFTDVLAEYQRTAAAFELAADALDDSDSPEVKRAYDAIHDRNQAAYEAVVEFETSDPAHISVKRELVREWRETDLSWVLDSIAPAQAANATSGELQDWIADAEDFAAALEATRAARAALDAAQAGGDMSDECDARCQVLFRAFWDARYAVISHPLNTPEARASKLALIEDDETFDVPSLAKALLAGPTAPTTHPDAAIFAASADYRRGRQARDAIFAAWEADHGNLDGFDDAEGSRAAYDAMWHSYERLAGMRAKTPEGLVALAVGLRLAQSGTAEVSTFDPDDTPYAAIMRAVCDSALALSENHPAPEVSRAQWHWNAARDTYYAAKASMDACGGGETEAYVAARVDACADAQEAWEQLTPPSLEALVEILRVSLTEAGGVLTRTYQGVDCVSSIRDLLDRGGAADIIVGRTYLHLLRMTGSKSPAIYTPPISRLFPAAPPGNNATATTDLEEWEAHHRLAYPYPSRAREFAEWLAPELSEPLSDDGAIQAVWHYSAAVSARAQELITDYEAHGGRFTLSRDVNGGLMFGTLYPQDGSPEAERIEYLVNTRPNLRRAVGYAIERRDGIVGDAPKADRSEAL